MSRRFFVDQPISGPTATLGGPEAHHLLHVMRAAVGDEITLFDGSGGEWAATISRVDRSSVEATLRDRRAPARELPFPLVLGVALPKGDRQKMLVEKLTELGVTRLVPLATERGLPAPKATALNKLRRAVIEACKQCGRNRLMAIDTPEPLEQFLRAAPVGSERVFAHPASQPWSTTASGPAGGAEIWGAIGPEGGFTEAEAEAAEQHGWRPASLGPRVLRIETAALALAAVLTVELPPPSGR